jgi:hypothetical protein
MSRKRGISPRQIDRIKELSSEGYSANKIQAKLSEEHIGLRRTILLTYVREFKRQPTKLHVEKHIHRKYIAIQRGIGVKRVVLYGRHNSKRTIIRQYGSGRELFRFVKRKLGSGFWDAKPEIES